MTYQDQKASFGRRGVGSQPAAPAARPAGGFSTFNTGTGRKAESDEEFRRRTQALVGDVNAMLRSPSAGEGGAKSGVVNEQMLLAYTASNQHYYAGVVQRMAANNDEFRSLTPSWIWGAFFFDFYWLLYRKLWLYAALHFVLAGAAFITFFRNPLLGGGLLLALKLGTAIFGKSLYIAKGAKRLRASLALQGSLDQITISRLGGSSVLAVVLCFILTGLVTLFIFGSVVAFLAAHPELMQLQRPPQL